MLLLKALQTRIWPYILNNESIFQIFRNARNLFLLFLSKSTFLFLGTCS